MKHADILSLFERYTMEERGLVTTAVLEYFAHGVVPSFVSRDLDTLFKAVVVLNEKSSNSQSHSEPVLSPIEEMTRRKQASLASADRVPDERIAGRIQSCNSIVKEDVKGKLSGLPCNCRSCADCRDRWAARQQAVMKQVLDIFEKSHSAVYQFVTLTVINVDPPQLVPTLDDMNKAWSRLMKRSAVKRAVLGSYKVIEVTQAIDGKAHPHFHVLFAFRPGYRFTQTEWKTLWMQVMGLDYSPQVNVENLRDLHDIRFKLDYMTKQGIDPAFEGVLRNKHLSSATGIFKELSALAKKDYKDYRSTLPKRDTKVVHIWADKRRRYKGFVLENL